MKAALQSRYGSPDTLAVRMIAKSTPQEHEVLVRVHATTVNRTDCAILRGQPLILRCFTGLFRPSSPVPGTDFAGKVEAIGKSVTRFNVGDRVWGFNDEGLASQAAYLTIREDAAVATIPDGLGYHEAVACAEGAHYAYNFINKVAITEQTRVLVNGATGAIGSSVVQLLKYYGAHVTAVCNTPNIALIESLGADAIIDYQRVAFTESDEQYDFIFDAVGKSSFSKCKHLLMPNGAYLSSELGPQAQNLYLPLLTNVRGGKRVIFPIPSDCRRTILFMKELLEQGKFQAVIDRHYPIDQIIEAYQYVESGEKTGNVIINY